MKTNNTNSLANYEPRSREGKILSGEGLWLSSRMLFNLAEIFAENIHTAVISMHLQAVRNPGDPSYLHPCFLDEIRATVCSLSGDERRSFVGSIRFHFVRLRAARGTDVKWQTYRDRVLGYESRLQQKEAA